jgi:4-hydroxybenzoate polyprenyltransferase
MQELRPYLALIRPPNVLTVLTNILAGYFSLTSPSDASAVQVSMLMASSSLLYISGIVFNDYFDLEVDRKERPGRPLPSGRVSRRNALALAIVTLVAANTIASLVSVASVMISVALSAVVIAYNYRAKRGVSGPTIMGLARFLNMFLGASPALLMVAEIPWTTVYAATTMFAYVYAITILSRREAGVHKSADYRRSIVLAFSLIVAVLLAASAFALYQRNLEMAVGIALLSVVTYFSLRQALSGAPGMQSAVRNLVLSIIILDSIFITAFAGLAYGLASLAIIAPSVALAKKLYVT